MALLTLPSGREFHLHNPRIITLLDEAPSEIADIEELLYIQERVNNIQEEFNKLSKILTTSKNPSVLGSIGETTIKDELTQLNIPWKDTSTIPHSADIELEVNKSLVFVDVKNYTNQVPSAEIEKLYRDCKENNINYAMLVSLKSNISRHKTFEMEQCGNVTMLYIRILTKYDLKTAINIMSILIESNNINKDCYINKGRIEQCLSILNEKTRDLVQMKEKCGELNDYVNKWSKDILKSLNGYQECTSALLLELKNECIAVPSNVSTPKTELIKQFKYDNWIFILNDLWAKDYDLCCTKGYTEMNVRKNNEIVASLSFQKSKVNIKPCNTHKITYCIENAHDWMLLLFSDIF